MPLIDVDAVVLLLLCDLCASLSVSGIQVRYLKIIEKSGYQALPWVRYITQNGDYQIRMS